MQIKTATMEDYDIAFSYFEKLWTFNTYDYEETKKVYEKVLADANSFVFFALDDAGNYHGLCHGSYFETFWMTGVYLLCGKSDHEQRRSWKRVWNIFIGLFKRKIKRERL